MGIEVFFCDYQAIYIIIKLGQLSNFPHPMKPAASRLLHKLLNSDFGPSGVRAPAQRSGH